MRKMFLIALLLAGCAQIPPTPQDIQAKKFESLPDKAVIYIVRTPMDSRQASGLMLDDVGPVGTLPRSYYRWEVVPGTHRIAEFAPFNGSVTVQAEAGKIYFVEYTVIGDGFPTPKFTTLQRTDERNGREMVLLSELL